MQPSFNDFPNIIVIVFVKLILGKDEGNQATTGNRRYDGTRREIDVRREFDLKVVLKGLGCKQRFLQPFLIEFPSNNCHCFCQIDIAENWGWRIYMTTTGK